MRLQLMEAATAAAERDAMRDALTKSQAAVAALNANCESLRRSTATGQRAQREWQLQIEGKMKKLIEERNRAAEDNLLLVQSTQAASAETAAVRQQARLRAGTGAGGGGGHVCARARASGAVPRGRAHAAACGDGLFAARERGTRRAAAANAGAREGGRARWCGWGGVR